jgi:type II secretory pathway component PulF
VVVVFIAVVVVDWVPVWVVVWVVVWVTFVVVEVLPQDDNTTDATNNKLNPSHKILFSLHSPPFS